MKKFNAKFNPRLNSYYDTSYQETAYIRSLAKDYFLKEDKEKAEIKTVEEFNARREKIRAKFKEILGVLPYRDAPLNVKVCNEKLLDDGITLQNIVYESLPKLYVSATLWLPENYNSGTKFPGVLMAMGHSSNGRACAEYATFARTLCKRGFVVLGIDPPGQYERRQYLKEDGSAILGTSAVLEHLHMGLPCNLAGIQVASFFVRDLERGIDLLQGLPYVDENKISMTGNSGGGTMTSYMAMYDERLVAVAPNCYTTSRIAFMDTGRHQDSEQVIPEVVSAGINNDDFVTAFAPKPFLVSGVSYDGSDIASTIFTYERAKKVYALFGAEENLKLNITPTRHGLFYPGRKGIIEFLTKIFYPEKANDEYVEQPAPEESEMRSTKSGNVLLEFADAKSVHDYYNEYFDANRYTDCDRKELKERIVRVLNSPEDLLNRPMVKFPRETTDEMEDGIRMRKFMFFTVGEEDFLGGRRIAVSGTLLEPKDAKKCVVLVSNYDDNDEFIDRELSNGNAVFVFYPRGFGASETLDADGIGDPTVFGRLVSPEFRRNSDAQMLGTSNAAFRVYDCAMAYDFIKQSYSEVTFAGSGESAVYALMTAGITDTTAEVSELPPSFESIVRDKFFVKPNQMNITGVLKEFDIPLLVKLLTK